MHGTRLRVSRRNGKEPTDKQIAGALALADGNVIQMLTGEGKTLTGALAAPVRALDARDVAGRPLAGKGVQWMALNPTDLLSAVRTVRPIARGLGLSVGVVRPYTSRWSVPLKRRAYGADIAIGTVSEFVFDALRARNSRGRPVYGDRGDFRLIDEVDQVLLDEALTPHVLATAIRNGKAPLGDLAFSAGIATKLRPRTAADPAGHYVLGRDGVTLTPDGIRFIAQETGRDLSTSANKPLVRHVENALTAKWVLERDVHYFVEDGRIVLEDRRTGHRLDGRRYNDGLAEAIEYAELVEVLGPTRVLDSMTVVDFLGKREFAGMTGTAGGEAGAAAFREYYNKGVVEIAPNRTSPRKDGTRTYRTAAEKWDGIFDDVVATMGSGRPVLVVAGSIREAAAFSQRLRQAGVDHNLLTAKTSAADQARILGDAGRSGQVTVATNIAGRGVDILLGGEAKGGARHVAVDEAGGLHVVLTEFPESLRVEFQARGRAARQGENGSSTLHRSLEDRVLQPLGKGEFAAVRTLDDSPLAVGSTAVDALFTRARLEAELTSHAQRGAQQQARVAAEGRGWNPLRRSGMPARQVLGSKGVPQPTQTSTVPANPAGIDLPQLAALRAGQDIEGLAQARNAELNEELRELARRHAVENPVTDADRAAAATIAQHLPERSFQPYRYTEADLAAVTERLAELAQQANAVRRGPELRDRLGMDADTYAATMAAAAQLLADRREARRTGTPIPANLNAPAERMRLAALSDRELQALLDYARGVPDAQIAARLGITPAELGWFLRTDAGNPGIVIDKLTRATRNNALLGTREPAGRPVRTEAAVRDEILDRVLADLGVDELTAAGARGVWERVRDELRAAELYGLHPAEAAALWERADRIEEFVDRPGAAPRRGVHHPDRRGRHVGVAAGGDVARRAGRPRDARRQDQGGACGAGTDVGAPALRHPRPPPGSRTSVPCRDTSLAHRLDPRRPAGRDAHRRRASVRPERPGHHRADRRPARAAGHRHAQGAGRPAPGPRPRRADHRRRARRDPGRGAGPAGPGPRRGSRRRGAGRARTGRFGCAADAGPGRRARPGGGVAGAGRYVHAEHGQPARDQAPAAQRRLPVAVITGVAVASGGAGGALAVLGGAAGAGIAGFTVVGAVAGAAVVIVIHLVRNRGPPTAASSTTTPAAATGLAARRWTDRLVIGAPLLSSPAIRFAVLGTLAAASLLGWPLETAGVPGASLLSAGAMVAAAAVILAPRMRDGLGLGGWSTVLGVPAGLRARWLAGGVRAALVGIPANVRGLRSDAGDRLRELRGQAGDRLRELWGQAGAGLSVVRQHVGEVAGGPWDALVAAGRRWAADRRLRLVLTGLDERVRGGLTELRGARDGLATADAELAAWQRRAVRGLYSGPDAWTGDPVVDAAREAAVARALGLDVTEVRRYSLDRDVPADVVGLGTPTGSFDERLAGVTAALRAVEARLRDAADGVDDANRALVQLQAQRRAALEAAVRAAAAGGVPIDRIAGLTGLTPDEVQAIIDETPGGGSGPTANGGGPAVGGGGGSGSTGTGPERPSGPRAGTGLRAKDADGRTAGRWPRGPVARPAWWQRWFSQRWFSQRWFSQRWFSQRLFSQRLFSLGTAGAVVLFAVGVVATLAALRYGAAEPGAMAAAGMVWWPGQRRAARELQEQVARAREPLARVEDAEARARDEVGLREHDMAARLGWVPALAERLRALGRTDEQIATELADALSVHPERVRARLADPALAGTANLPAGLAATGMTAAELLAATRAAATGHAVELGTAVAEHESATTDLAAARIDAQRDVLQAALAARNSGVRAGTVRRATGLSRADIRALPATPPTVRDAARAVGTRVAAGWHTSRDGVLDVVRGSARWTVERWNALRSALGTARQWAGDRLVAGAAAAGRGRQRFVDHLRAGRVLRGQIRGVARLRATAGATARLLSREQRATARAVTTEQLGWIGWLSVVNSAQPAGSRLPSGQLAARVARALGLPERAAARLLARAAGSTTEVRAR
ncbi:hypothetical protein BJF90_22060 [Pseudonocardia sp. CNS-004]|nr:hypothetical protein BJF90_22060 [Pseudonocardia sp. CNS-004]